MGRSHTWRLGIGALTALALNMAAHALCERLPATSTPSGAWMSPALARVVSGAHKPAVADAAWLQAVKHRGDPRLQAQGDLQLLPLLARVVALDPHFAAAYQFIGTAVDYSGAGYDAAMALLQAGIKLCPGAWRIAFFSGFNAYWYGGDYARAAADLATAALSAEAPPHTGLLATRLAAEAGQPEIGIRLIDTLLAATDPDDNAYNDDEGAAQPQKMNVLLQRRQSLELDIQLGALNASIVPFFEAHPNVPHTWDTLISHGIVEFVPRDPWGAPLVLSADAAACARNDRLLRLSDASKGSARAGR